MAWDRAILFLGASTCSIVGFLYLFHIHFVFYAPLLIVLVSGARIVIEPGKKRSLWGFSALCGVTAFAHPYSLLILLAVTVGTITLTRKSKLVPRFRSPIKKKTDPLFLWQSYAVLLSVGGILTIYLLSNPGAGKNISWILTGWYTSYVSLESPRVLGVLPLLLGSLVLTRFPVGVCWKGVLVVCLVLLGNVFFCHGIPLSFLLISVCLINFWVAKLYGLLFLLGVTLLFPLGSATGSPSYALFAVILCSFAPQHRSSPNSTRWTSFMKAWMLPAVVAMTLVLVVLLRSGVRLPVISRIVLPLQMEREKTIQLDRILNWYFELPEPRPALILANSARSPVEELVYSDRRFRAPTTQKYLDYFLRRRAEIHQASPAEALIVAFGGKEIPGATTVHVEQGVFAGQATVILQSTSQK